jgi:branched-chain amino acid transport system permease protein
MVLNRPSLFGLSLDGGTAFFYFELAVMGLMLLLARNLRSGRLGRILGAMRDSETAASSVGIDLRTYKLFVFATGAFIAGIGGSLLAMAESSTFEARLFDPLSSLFWFTAVIVAGVGSISGALLAAFIFVMLPLILGVDVNSAQFFIGVGALLLGRLRGGLIGVMVRSGRRLAASRRTFVEQEREAERAAVVPAPALEPTDFAHRVLDQARS